LFGNNLDDELKKSLIVFFTHCPEKITLKKINIHLSKMIVDDASDSNTPEVVNMLDLIVGLMIGKNKNRVEIIRACSFEEDHDEEEQHRKKLFRTIKSTPKIENPGEFCKVSLTDVAKLTLQETLSEIKRQIPNLVVEGKIDTILEYILSPSKGIIHSCN
jgi:hypothetical protein